MVSRSAGQQVSRSVRDCRTLAISAMINAAFGIKPGIPSLAITPLPFAGCAGLCVRIYARFAGYGPPNAPASPACPPAMSLPAERGAAPFCPNWRVSQVRWQGHARGSCARAELSRGFVDRCNAAPPKVSRKVTVNSGAEHVHIGCHLRGGAWHGARKVRQKDNSAMGKVVWGCPLPTGVATAGRHALIGGRFSRGQPSPRVPHESVAGRMTGPVQVRCSRHPVSGRAHAQIAAATGDCSGAASKLPGNGLAVCVGLNK